MSADRKPTEDRDGPKKLDDADLDRVVGGDSATPPKKKGEVSPNPIVVKIEDSQVSSY